MFNIGFSELVILAVIGLLVLGPEQLPEVAKKLAKIINDLKRAKEEILSPVDDFKREAQRMLDETRRRASQLEADALMNRKLEPHGGDPVPPSVNEHHGHHSDAESTPDSTPTIAKPEKKEDV